MQTIDIGFNNVEKILHIADIHIRNYKRHKEYRQVFKELYIAAKALPAKSLIYIAGDIVHNKIDMSPELIQLTSEFLSNLADIRPTIFIRGNHDMNLNNKSRMDALKPIYDSLKHDNLWYLSSTDVYEIADVYFSVFDIADDPKNYILAKDIPDDKLKVALFHGAVDSSMTDAGFKVRNENHSIKMFTNYDAVLLGDIHKNQYLDFNKTVHYPGSLIQQNFGESYENHGYTTWDLSDLSSSFTNINNDYGFYTIDIDNGILPNINNIPAFPRLRIRTSNTTEAELKKLMLKIRKKSSFSDAMVIKRDKVKGTSESKIAKALLKDVRDVEYQNDLIEDYISRNYTIEPAIMDRIKNLNRSLNTMLSPVEISRNISWKPKKFEFENMFSYGENNIIDFENVKGLMGLFASNHSGKSAILDSIAFCLFDKCSRTKKAEDVMNNKSLNFKCKLTIEVDGVDYFIERKAKRVKSGKSNVRVDVDFSMMGEDNSIISLNGEQRRDTNKNIRGYVGTYEDFVLTSLSVQNNGVGFIGKSQTERKDLLAQFMDITVFEELYQIANEEIRDVQVLLKEFKKTDYDVQLIDSADQLSDYNSELITIKKSKTDLKNHIKKLSDKVITLSKSIKSDTHDWDINSLEIEKDKYLDLLANLSRDISNLNLQSVSNKSKHHDIARSLEFFNSELINTRVTEYYECLNKKSKLEIGLDKLKAVVKQKLKLVSKLSTHSYDPNCEHCINNEFVKQAEKAKLELPEDRSQADSFISDISKFDQEAKALKDYTDQKESYDSLILDMNEIQAFQKNLLLKVKSKEANQDYNTQKLTLVKSNIESYHKNKKLISFNRETQTKISTLEIEILKFEKTLEDVESNLLESYSNIKLAKNKIDTINDSIEKADELENKLKAYEYYLDSIKRDGVPYELIADALPYIEEAVNEILSQIVEFNIKFETDGKNILTYIKYDKSMWPLEMTSGMEKFISSLAIRVALVNVSNLPRPNFLAIDEGFGNLDSDNLNSMFMLFEYLKTEFDFILIISHLDALKDAADGLFEINITDGFSKIKF
tara:strand:+ start:1387 stop:4539 length:3153 start_codon:yes stop_codon:yes gene_type:complete